MRVEFELESPDEMLILLGAIYAAKFSQQPFDLQLLASSIEFQVSSRLLNCLKAEKEKQLGKAGIENFETFYRLSPERREWELAKRNGVAAFQPVWKTSPSEKHVELVKVLVSPFHLDENYCQQFILELDKLISESEGYAWCQGLDGVVKVKLD